MSVTEKVALKIVKRKHQFHFSYNSQNFIIMKRWPVNFLNRKNVSAEDIFFEEILLRIQCFEDRRHLALSLCTLVWKVMHSKNQEKLLNNSETVVDPGTNLYVNFHTKKSYPSL